MINQALRFLFCTFFAVLISFSTPALAESQKAVNNKIKEVIKDIAKLQAKTRKTYA